MFNFMFLTSAINVANNIILSHYRILNCTIRSTVGYAFKIKLNPYKILIVSHFIYVKLLYNFE